MNDNKLLHLDTIQDAAQIIRFVCNSKLRDVRWREIRPYLLADKIQFNLNENDTENGTLLVSGYLRGNDLNVNNIVHIPDLGDFQLKQVDLPSDPYQTIRKSKDTIETDSSAQSMVNEPQVLAVADPFTQESLQSENIPDAFAAEQTWPTEEELSQAEKRMESIKGKKVKKLVPKGTSSYQAAWLIDSDDEQDDEEEVEEEDEEEEENNHEDKMAEETVEKQSTNEENANKEEAALEEEMEEMEELEELNNTGEELDKDFQLMLKDKKQKNTQESTEDLEFPDEMDTPVDMPARIRFQKYRGLKSFRTSPWDPKENLPIEYSRIFQFQNFNRAKKNIK